MWSLSFGFAGSEQCVWCWIVSLHVSLPSSPDNYSPRTPGHEVIGRVVAVGEGVESWKVGDR